MTATAPSHADDPWGVVWEDTPVLRPGIDIHDNTVYMTFPTRRTVTKTVGRGKSTREVTEQVPATICIASDGTYFLYDAETLAEQGFAFPPAFTHQATPRWPKDDALRFVKGYRPPVDPPSLYTTIRQVYVDHVEYSDETFYDLMPLYVMATYVFPIFAAFPYIHFNGSRASGKSTNLKILSALAFNTVQAANISSAALFRTVAGCPGVVCIDEAEDFETERGKEIRLLLNSGYQRGGSARRVEKNAQDSFVSVDFPVFGPKVLASIHPLDPTLASRCIVVQMQPAIRTVPEFRDDDPRWATLRSQLYHWTLLHGANVNALRATWETERFKTMPDIRSRQWELAAPFVVLADHVGGTELVTKISTFLRTTFESATKTAEDNDRQYLLIKCLPRVLAEKTPHEGGFYSLKDIHDLVTNYLEEDAREYYKTRTVGRHLTSLGLSPGDRKQTKGGTLVRLHEDWVRDQMRKRHVTPFDEDVDWYEGHISRTGPTRVTQRDEDLIHDLWSTYGDSD